MENYIVTYLKKLTNFIKGKNFFMLIPNILKEAVACFLFSAITSALTVISFQLFKKYKNRIIRQKKIKSNQFKLKRQLIVLWNKLTRNIPSLVYVPFTKEEEKLITYYPAMLWFTYEKNRKLYEMNNLNTFCMMKFKMQLQGKSHLLIKNSGMMIGAFHKLATSVLLR